MFNENGSCVPCEIPSPGPAPMTAMLAEAHDLTQKALAMAMNINSQCFGKGAKERNGNEPRCMRDAIAAHVDDLKALCEELDGICQGFGV